MSFKKYFNSQVLIREVSGAFGDLGTLVPILVSMSLLSKINVQSSLILGGLFNIITGYLFQMPICVQPMKAIAASALILEDFSLLDTMSSGFIVGLIIFVLGSTRIISFFNENIIHYPIVKGIQLGTALQLSKKAVSMIDFKKFSVGQGMDPLENIYFSLFVFALIIFFTNNSQNKNLSLRIPICLILTLVGALFSIIFVAIDNNIKKPSYKIFDIYLTIPGSNNFKNGTSVAIGQIFLTIFNSVIALCTMANELFPENTKMNVNNVSISVGLMNIFGCFFGMMPYCHGSGGLAAQYKFGARTETSVYFLGAIKIVLGFIMGNHGVYFLNKFPKFILANLLFFSGLELAANTIKFSNFNNIQNGDFDHNHEIIRNDYLVFVSTAASLIAFNNAMYGVICGLIVYGCLRIKDSLSSYYYAKLNQQRNQQA